MFLKRLEVSGFKSFANKTVIDFDGNDTITAIVGPNGSGKSNIADAVRWVLGEQSYKTIRSKKSEDVIFSGSNSKNKASSARVLMILDNSDKKAPLDFSEVQIERAVYRDGASEYLINGKKSRLLDVAELLAKSGFGQSTYSVIGQGMVDSMLFYGPAERKVLFDEAAGVRQYEIKREQATRKLADTAQNIIRVKDILSELNPRLKNLQRQTEKAQKKEEIYKKLREKQKIYFVSVWEKIILKEKEANKELSRMVEEEEEIKSELNDLNNEFNDVLNREKSDGTKVDKIRRVVDDLEEKKDKLKQMVYEKKAQINVLSLNGVSAKDIEEKIKALNNEINSLYISDKENQKAKIRKEVSTLEQKIASINKSIKDKKSTLQELEDKFRKTGLNNIKKELLSILDEQNLFLIKLNSAKSLDEVKKISAQGNKISARLEKIVSSLAGPSKKNLKEVEKIQNDIKKLLGQKEELFSELNQAKGKLVEISYLLEAAVRQRKEIKDKIEDLKKITPVDDKDQKKLEKEIADLNGEIEKIDKEIVSKRAKLNFESGDLSSVNEKLSDLKDKISKKQALLSEYNQEITNLKIEIAKIETRKQDLREEIEKEIGGEAELAQVESTPELDEVAALEEIEKLKNQYYAIGEIDPEVGAEFEEVSKRVEYLNGQVSDLEKAKKDLEKLIAELDDKIKKQFQSAFDAISKNFKHFFNLLFNGGEASLNLVRQKDEENKEESFGIEISAVPPGKRVKSLSALSGGERTLTSLALLFAILSVNPAPFILLDEVDAALDENNTKRFLKIVRELSSKTQFIFITHNRETMKEANTLYGVTMDDNHVSKLLSIRLEEAVKSAKA